MDKLTRRDKVAIGVAMLGMVFLFGDEIVSKINSWKQVVRDSVEKQVPLEIEIDRAKRRTEELAKNIIRQRQVVLSQKQDVDKLRADVAFQEQELGTQKEKLFAMRSLLQHQDQQSVAHVPDQLTIAFENYRLAESTLDARRELFRIRSQELLNTCQELRAMENRRGQLLLQVENLVARLELIRTKKDTQQVVLDTSEVERCESQLTRLDSRLQFMEGMLNENMPVDVQWVSLDDGRHDIGQEIDEYFGVKISLEPTPADRH